MGSPNHLSALASTLGGIVRSICLAAFKLMAKSNLVGYSTGGEIDRDTALAGRLLSKVPHNAIDRCLTRAVHCSAASLNGGQIELEQSRAWPVRRPDSYPTSPQEQAHIRPSTGEKVFY